MKILTLGGGCFWCLEACFKTVNGITSVKNGYAGGTVVNPTYKEICTGKTNHAEVLQLQYNPAIIATEKILEAFFAMHDPTTLNRQDNDVGTQYRSIILYHDNEQYQIAKTVIERLNKEIFNGNIVTELKKFDVFYPAEDYHHDYYDRNPDQPYCKFVIHPKLKKFREKF